jgi:hypothetical protein
LALQRLCEDDLKEMLERKEAAEFEGRESPKRLASEQHGEEKQLSSIYMTPRRFFKHSRKHVLPLRSTA